MILKKKKSNNDLLGCEEKILEIAVLKEKSIYSLTSWASVVAPWIIERGKWEDGAPLNGLSPFTNTTNPPSPNVRMQICLCPNVLAPEDISAEKLHWEVTLHFPSNTSNASLEPLFHHKKIQTPQNLLGNVIVFTDLHMAENVGQLLGNENFDLIHRATQL